MNFNVKGKFMKRTARAMMMVLLFSFALSVFLYAGVSADSALIPNDMLDASVEPGIAQADWTHPGGIAISDSNSGGRKVTAMPTITTAGSTDYYSTDANNTPMSKFGIFMSNGGSGDRKQDANTVAIDQGISDSVRKGMLYAVIPLDAYMQNLANSQALTLSFSAYFEGGNSKYSTYRIFAYSSSTAVSAGTTYEHSTFKNSILNSGSNATSSTTGNSTTATGNTGYCNATGIPDKSWDSSHSDFSYRTITANVLPGAKSVIIGVMVEGGGWGGIAMREMEVSMGKPTVTFSGSAKVTINTSGSGALSASAQSGVAVSGTSYTFNKGADTITMTANPSTGYQFTGWSDGSTANPRTFTGLNVEPGKTYTAKFEQVVTFTYNANGGAGVDISSFESPNKTITLRTDCPFTRAGYYFVGWNTSANSTTSITSVTTGAGGSTTTIYAIWKPISYTITYDANGGSGTVGQTTGTYNGSDAPLAEITSSNRFVKDDGFFMGWDTVVATVQPSWLKGTYPNYSMDKNTMATYLTQLQGGDITKSSVSFTLYAIWTNLEFGNYASGTGQWGSASNPYVIRTKDQLANLSKLTNGTDYNSVNSGIIGSITGSSYAIYTNPLATDRTYSGCYFELAADVNTGGTLTDDSFGNVTYTVATNADWGNNNEKLTNIRDGDVSTKFCDPNVAGFEFQYNMSSEEYVDSFTFTNAADAESYPKRIPEYFSIQGSRDGSTWTTICTVRDSNHNWSASGGKYTIQLDKPGYYRYFKVYVRSRRGFEINSNVNTDYVEESKASPLQFADLSFSGATVRVGGTHTPIGKDSSHSFKGNFDGNYHTITYTSTVIGDRAGLFGFVLGGSIKNLKVAGEVYATGSYVGGVISEVNHASVVVENVSSSVKVTGKNYTGGIVGIFHNGKVEDCTNSGAINAVNGDSVGGIVGRANNSAQIIGCTNSGAVTGMTYVGGIVGSSFNPNSNVVITDATNSGEVHASGDYVGGILGGTQTTSYASISGTLSSTGGVSGTNYVGGIVGRWYGSGSFNWSATINITNTALPHGTVVSGASYVGGAIGMLSSDVTITGKITFSRGNVDGKVKPGTSDSPQSGQVIGGIVGYNAGTITATTAFNGGRVLHRGGSITVDGVTGAFLGGIVGFNAGTIKNATKGGTQDTISFTNGSNYVGGIAGYNTGTIDNCLYKTNSTNGLGYNSAISERSNYVGGIAGYSTGTISNCTVNSSGANIVLVYGTNYVGGVVGYVGGGGTVTNCTAHANVNGASYVGGYIGLYESTSALTISDRTRSGSVTGTGNYVGGFVGNTNSEAEKIFKNLSNSGAITGASKVGGIVGEINHANGGGSNHFITCSNTGAITGTTGGDIGGIVGYSRDAWYYGCVNGTSETKSTQISGKNGRVGGIVGGFDGGTVTSSSTSGTYAGSVARNSANYMTITTSAGESVGGIAGYANWIADGFTFNNSDNYGTVTASSATKVGGVVGFFAQGSASSRYTLSNCTNSGAVSGSSYVGGIAGHSQALQLKVCTNTGNVTASTNAGGIVGVADSGGTVSNCVSSGAVGNGSNLGGIVGNNAGTISYTYFNGTVRGASYVGGIAGSNSSSINYSYVQNGANVTATGSNVGGVVGSSSQTINTAWAFYHSATKTSGHNTGTSNTTGKYVINAVGGTIIPAPDTSWSTISTSNIDRFYFQAGIVAPGNQYLSLETLSTSGAVSGYAGPTVGSLNGSTHDTSNGTCTFTAFGYGAGYSSNVRARFMAVGSDFHDLIYDGTDKAGTDNQTEAFAEDVRGVANYTSYYQFTLANKSDDTVNVGTFTYDAHMVVGGVIMGCARGQSATIRPFDINSDECHILFDGIAYGGLDTYSDHDLGKTLTDITSFKTDMGVINYNPNAVETFYIYRFKSNGDKILVYSVQLEYGGSLMPGTHHEGYGVTIDLDGIINTSHEAVQAEGGYLVNRMQEGSTTFVPSANYCAINDKGWLTLNYYAIDSDYGEIAVTDRNGDGTIEHEWGSVDNPYVISHWIHLLRLGEIVNSVSAPINSVRGIGAGNSSNARSDNSMYSAYVGADGKVKESYFLISVANITIPDTVNFRPIGGWIGISAFDGEFTVFHYENSNSNYFGGILDGQFADGAYATIDLGSQLSDLGGFDYLGLFGLAKGCVLNGTVAHAEIKNINVKASGIRGNNYVGTVVGDANAYVIIDSAYANKQLTYGEKNTVTIAGSNYVGSVVGSMGVGTEIYGDYVNYAQVTGATYVGGFVGCITSGAGRQGTGANANNYYLGEYVDYNGATHRSSMVNYGTINATGSCVGGIVGAMVQSTGAYSGVITVFEPTFIRNEADVFGGEYVGGLIGNVELNNAVRLINTKEEGQANWSYNGSVDTTFTVQTATNYAGGLFGRLSTMGHQFTSVFSTTQVRSGAGSGSSDGKYIGGLVGYMNGGTFNLCFVTVPGTQVVSTTTSLVQGNAYVGGLAGEIALGTFDNCYVQGYKFDGNLSNTKGGVAGVAATVATVKDTWALYLTTDPDYRTVPANSNGKYIVSFCSGSDGAMNATISELFVFAGLLDDSAIASDRHRATGTSAGEITATKGSISLGITLPGVGTITNYAQKAQVTFYNGSGYEEAYEHAFEAGANDSAGNNLFIRIGSSSESVIIAKTAIRFGSVSNYTNSSSWEEKYLYIGKTGLYKIDVADHPTDDGNYHRGNYQTSYSYDYSATGNYVYTSRYLTFQYAKYSEVAPRVIASVADWNAFATDVKNSGVGGLRQYVKLANNITVTQSNLAGRESTDDISAHNFQGTFDGDGYTITINIDGASAASRNELGLFPQAGNATFKNLTIKGTWTNLGNDCGAFVGHARGWLTFENCISDVDMSGNGHSHGGILGSTSAQAKYDYTFIACVNLGNITSYESGSEAYGVGGIIGNVWNGTRDSGNDSYSGTFGSQPIIRLDSCRNAGNIMASYNVGGIIGRTGGATEIINCGNTGNIDALCEGTPSSPLTSNSKGKDGSAGGIIGLVGGSGYADVYASYNHGNVHAWGNKAGGIMGSDTEYTTQSHVTKVYYCYNTGTISTGTNKHTRFSLSGNWTDEGSYYFIQVFTGESFGANCGGILGTAVNSDIRYCYNIGDVILRGVVGEGGAWHGRIGGIVGMVDGTATYVRNCYNVGDIKIDSRRWSATVGDQRPRYAGGIIGYHKGAEDTTPYVINCYSLKYQVHWLNMDDKMVRFHVNGGHKSAGITYGDGSTLTNKPDHELYGSSGGPGHVLDSVADFTAVMKSNEEVSTNSVNSLNNSNESDARVLTTNDIKSGSYPGWIFMPGCLPQLAVFAVDTQNGLAMTSLGYGRDNMGQYVQQVAGSEFNPYVIKDGIDLMGVMALTSAKGGGATFGFNGKYIEFANGTNNLMGDVCTYIQMPTSDVNSGSDYKFYNGRTGALATGKSYHLYDRGANGLHGGTLSKSNGTTSDNTAPATSFYATGAQNSDSGALNYNSSTAYATWKGGNYAYNGSSWASNQGYSVNNWNPIGYLGDKSASYDRSFRGHISGYISDTQNAEIRGLKSYYGFNKSNVYAGLFGVVNGATVEHITVTGTIQADNLGSGVASAGIVGKAINNSRINGLQAGTASNALTIKTGKGSAGYTGGIIGMTDSGPSGNRLVIEDCHGVNATITGFKDSIGGILGYTVGADAASFTDIIGCHVAKATITSTASIKRLLGGIVGAQGAHGAVTVEDCRVGTKGASGSNVTIKGDNSVGGIISYADAGTTCANAFIDCYVYDDVLISRFNANNDGEYGTAIGGIVGYISNNTGGYATFRDHIEFYGTIELGNGDTTNVGGVVGYMGSSARMEECLVQVYGSITTPTTGTVSNIGGFAGISKGVALDGGFAIAPTLNTSTADNVGGFIGLNDGDTYITRTSIIYTSSVIWTDKNADGEVDFDEVEPNNSYQGSILADEKVGGFIGSNNAELHMGASEYKGTVYGDDSSSANIELYASVDGKKYVGGFLGYNVGTVYGEYCRVVNNGYVGTKDHSKWSDDPTDSESNDCFGGVFGDNSVGGKIEIGEKAYFINNGQVGHSDYQNAKQEFVGGVIGVALGNVVNKGTLQNTGAVYGYEYVGGAIGGLVNGTISGVLINGEAAVAPATSYVDSEALEVSDVAVSTAESGQSSVTAVLNVGGVIGIVMQNATISGANMVNHGNVSSSGDSYFVSNLGGAIGLNYGVIEGSNFYNYGTITAKNFAGGALGVSDGVIRDSKFYNYATITFTGDTALGGAVGYITNNYTSHGSANYYPGNNSVLGSYDSTRNRSTVTGSYFGYESSIDSKVVLQATGEHPYPLTTILGELGNDEMSAFVAKGGLGGVFGAINSDYMTKSGGWGGNTFFIYGDVYGGVFLDGNTQNFTPENFAGTVDAVGGVIGAVEVSYITIHDMLIYKSNVGGRDYVGGIVGYNDNSNATDGKGASIDNCYNVYGEVIGTTLQNSTSKPTYNYVGGIVGFVPSASNPGKINDASNFNKPTTEASYWIKSYSNEHLQNSNPKDIVNTLDKASTWTEFLSHADYVNNTDPYYKEDQDGNVINAGVLAEGQTWDEYFAIHTEYVQNANEDWGTYSAVDIKYTTGEKATGFYYIFAEPGDNFEYAMHAIEVEHKNTSAPLTTPYSNDQSLNYWLIIANSASQSIKEYASEQVAPEVNNGNVIPGYIYSTAYASTKNGYYLYISDGSTGNSATKIYVDSTDDSKVYVSSNAAEAGNVMIFYKEAVMLNHLNYNGYERYAPISELEYKQDMSGGVFGKQYYLFIDDVPGDNINTGKDAGSYDIQANIYTVDSKGSVFTLGAINSLDVEHGGADYKWNIRKRTLEVEFETGDIGEQGEDQNLWNRYDGTFSHYIKFTVTNFAKDENLGVEEVYEAIDDMLSIKYSMNGGSSTESVTSIYDSFGFLSGTKIPDASGFGDDVKFISYYTTGQAGSSAKPGDKGNTIVDGNYTEIGSLEIYQATYIVFVKKAGKHTVKVEVAGSEVNHASPKKNTKDYTVDMRDISLSFTYSEGSSLLPSYLFDGGANWQGITSITLSGFLAGDALVENILTDDSTASLIDGNGKANKDHMTQDDGANTVTINFFASNAGTYKANLVISEAIRNNYRFVSDGAGFTGTLTPSQNSYEWDASWTINPYQINLKNVEIAANQKFVYNGEVQTPTFSGAGGADFVVNHGKETVTVYCDANVTDGTGVTKAVNVGTYKIDITAGGTGDGSGTVEGDDSKATAGIKNYKINYTLAGNQQAVTFEIVKREVRLVWDKPTTSYVYTGSTQGLGATDLKFEMKNDNGTWVEYTKARITIEGNMVKVDKVFEHDGMSETLYFDIAEFTAKDAGSYTAEVTEFDSVTGNNDAGTAQKTNYTATLPADKNYSIAQSQIVVTYNNTTNLNKTFDNTSTVTKNLGGYTLDSQNDGAEACTVTMTGAYYCDANGNAMVNVGSGYYVRINLSLSDTKNYTLVKSTITPQVNASITPAPLTITLNNSSSGQNTVYKTFDNSTLYAEVESNGTNKVSSSGVQMRTGRGITVSGFFTSGVTVTANFAEIDANRAWASKYVNNVTRTVSTPYVYSMSNDDFYKKLVITLSNNDGGIQANNYYIAAVATKSGTVILTQSSGQTIEVMDSRAENSNTNGDNIKIAITKYSLKATYSNTAQSYANPDNSYNLDWLAVDGTLKIPSSWGLSSSDLDVDVTNGWMYANGTSGETKKYEQYTRIAGSANSTRLGAKLSSDEGYDLCVTLRNQPTLVIGYFVSQSGEEIGTMAGLLIATEYYKNNFNESGAIGYDFTQTVISLADLDNLPAEVKTKIKDGVIDTWEKLIEEVPEYDVRGYEYNGNTYYEYKRYLDLMREIERLEAIANKTEQQVTDLEALRSQLDSYELTYVALTDGAEETLQYVYWQPEKVSENRTFKSFVLVNNIDAILTQEDMDMLTGAFGKGNWGVGKKYLGNVLYAEVGSVVIFNGPVFDYVLDGEGNPVAFNGEFDGSGYYIDHLTIAYNATTAGEHSIGMFAEVSGVGSKVTGVNLRNLNVQVIDGSASASTVLNIGGVAGKFAGSTLMEDVTVHGTITAKSSLGTVYVGGVIGSDSTGYVNAGVSKVIDGAIVVATIRAEGAVAVAGGIVGVMNEVNTTLTDVVSLSEIYAKGNTTYANGFVGRYNKYVNGQNYGMSDGIDYAPVNTDGKTSAYMNSVFEINGDTYTQVAGGVSYTELMNGSTSAFDGNNAYVNALDVAYGKYDVVSEKNAIAGKNTTGSMRLRDIVEVYVLGYELSAHTVGTGNETIVTVKKSTTSKYVGTADGTTGNAIKIAYQQHLTLIRMFNYMNFVISNDVTMYTGYTLKVVDEAFTGSVNANGHTVNVRGAEYVKDFVADGDSTAYPQFFKYQSENFTWLKKD